MSGEIPEFFVSRLQHVEDMGNGNARFWYCVDRTAPDGTTETKTVLRLIVPIAAVPSAAALRKSVLGQVRHIAAGVVQPRLWVH